MPVSDNRLTERVQAAIRAAVRETGGTRFLVACSGGGDSVCLAHATITVSRKEGWDVALGHVRHGVRQDDAEDAALVKRLARELAVPVFVHLYAPESLSPDEAALRQARYGALADMATEFRADAVLTGHTLDDQAETVLLRLLRGAGVDGLGGIAPSAAFPAFTPQSLRVMRPLLALPRAATRAYCAANDLAYRDDPTNADLSYHRNWVRHAVLPVLMEQYPAAIETIARAADLMRDDAIALDDATEAALTRCHIDWGDVTILNRAALRHESVPLQRRMLRTLLKRFGETPRYDRLEIIRRAVCEGYGTTPTFAREVCIWPAYDAVIIGHIAVVQAAVRHRALQRHPLARLSAPVSLAESFTFPRDPSSPAVSFSLHLWSMMREKTLPGVSAFLRLPENASLLLRNRRPGDVFRPANGRGTHKLQDYLSREHVPEPLRDELPLLVMGDEIVAVIGYDTSVAFAAAVSNATHAVFLERTTDTP